MRPMSSELVWESASQTRGEIGRESRGGSVLSGKAHCFDQNFCRENSCQNVSDHARRLHAGQLLFQALKPVVKLVMIESE